jgi:hypothetical protein
MTATINELIAEVNASAGLGQLVSFVALNHHQRPRMVKPAEPPALSQGSARKSATGAGWGALCAAGFRFGGGGGASRGGNLAAGLTGSCARRSASARVSGSAFSL